MSVQSMQIDTNNQSRRAQLSDAVTRALTSVFNSPEVLEELQNSSKDGDAAEKHAAAQAVVSDILNIVKQSVSAQVDNWAAERGLDQTLKVVDEYCLQSSVAPSADSAVPSLPKSCSTNPEAMYARAKLNCKTQKFGNLKKDLEKREKYAEELKGDVARLVEAARLISEKLGDSTHKATAAKLTAEM